VGSGEARCEQRQAKVETVAERIGADLIVERGYARWELSSTPGAEKVGVS